MGLIPMTRNYGLSGWGISLCDSEDLFELLFVKIHLIKK